MKPETLVSRKQQVALVLCTVAIGSVLAGCSADQAPVNEDAKAALLSVVSLPPELWAAVQLDIAQCMNVEGFQYVVDSSSASGPAASANLLGAAGVWDSVEQAEQSGYQTSVELSSAPEDQAAYVASLSAGDVARYQTALLGDESKVSTYTSPLGFVVDTPADGCQGQAVAAIYGSGENYLQLTSLFNETREPLSGKDVGSLPGVGSAVTEYSQCMREAGYEVNSLADTGALAEQRFGASRAAGEGPGAEELEMATTDASCQDNVDLAVRMNDAFVSVAGQWLDANEDKLLKLVDIRTESLQRAKASIEG